MATGNALALLWSDTGDLNIEGGLVCDAWLQYLFLLTGHDENLWQNVREKGDLCALTMGTMMSLCKWNVRG